MPDGLSFVANLTVAAPGDHLGLRIYPLLAPSPGIVDPGYRILSAALEAGTFEITEVSDSGTVPALRARNTGDRPVLLLDGEELVGAKQNRVLNLSVMVDAGSECEIPVSCVEAGRWRQASRSFSGSDSAQFARGRARKLDQVTKSLDRSGTARSDQHDVWNEIAVKAQRLDTASPTAAMKDIYDHHHGTLEAYIDAHPWREGQIGAVFVIGGRIAGMDAFDAPATCSGLWGKLLRSYALDAMEAQRTTGGGQDMVEAFLGEVGRAPGREHAGIGMGTARRFTGDAVSAASLEVAGRCIHLAAFPRSSFEDELSDGEPDDRDPVFSRVRRH